MSGTRIGRLVAVLAAVGIAVSGCSSSGGADGSSADSSSANSSTPSSSADSSGSEAASSAGPSSESSSEPAAEPDPTATIRLASWRTEDAEAWEKTIIPAFNKAHPNITVVFEATKSSEYTPAVSASLKGGTAADVLMCQPFAPAWTWIKQGNLESIDNLEAVKQFPDQAFDAWTTDDGHKYCLPLNAVQADFLYNKKIFTELGLSIPTTQQEFIDLLKKVQDDGRYEPLAYGTADAWVPQVLGFDLVAPNYIKGNEGHQKLLKGEMQFNDPSIVAAIQAMGDWRPYLPKGASSINFDDQAALFASGKAAVWPTGSFAIAMARGDGVDVGTFAPPVAKSGDPVYINLHPDQAMAINAASENKDAAKVFLNWLASDEFTKIYADTLPGFFSFRKNPPAVEDPLVQDMLNIQTSAAGYVQRISIGILTSGGNPPLEAVIAGSLQEYLNNPDKTAQQVADGWQEIFAATYKPSS